MDNRSINPYDLRMLNVYLKENKITKEEYDAHIKSLDDLSDNIGGPIDLRWTLS